MGYRWLADLVMLVHFGFVAYVALGGFLAWWRPWLLLPHALAASWGALTVTAGLTCPLTAWEVWARERAGQQGLPAGFIDTYLTGVVYPERHLLLVQLLVAGVVAVSWAGALIQRRARTPVRSTHGAGGMREHAKGA